MNIVEFLHQWQVLLIPFSVVIITQLLKLVFESGKHGFSLAHLNSYGGMPSTHTAGFTSLTLMVGFVEGFTTSLFAVTAAVAAVVIRDAVGIRWSLGLHGKVLNHMLESLPKKEQEKLPHKLHDRLGHTYPEMFAGLIIGGLLTVIFYSLLS